MTSHDEVSSIFREPEQWGLRGDPFLWEELREQFLTDGIPKTISEFMTCLEEAFLKIAGAAVSTDGSVFIQRYDQGGMSSGHVDLSWWRTTGIPLLGKQFNEHFDGSARRSEVSVAPPPKH